MPLTSRIMDMGMGVCPACMGASVSTLLIMGAGTILVDAQPVSRMTDMLIGSCGHPAIMVGGSSTEISENLGTARLGDAHSGIITGVLVMGSSKDITGG